MVGAAHVAEHAFRQQPVVGKRGGDERVGVVDQDAPRAIVADDARDRPAELARLEDRPVPGGAVAVIAPVVDRVERLAETERAGRPAPARAVRRPRAPGERDQGREGEHRGEVPHERPGRRRPEKQRPAEEERARQRDGERRVRRRVAPQRRLRREPQREDGREREDGVLGERQQRVDRWILRRRADDGARRPRAGGLRLAS
jgi:hypothetical protein